MTKYTTWVAIGLNFVATMVCIGTFGALNPYSGKELYNVSRDLNRAFTASGSKTSPFPSTPNETSPRLSLVLQQSC